MAVDENGERIKTRSTCEKLINLAISENRDTPEYNKILKTIKEKYYKPSSEFDKGNNRHSTLHGYMHPDSWTKESFEELIQDIATLSKYSKF